MSANVLTELKYYYPTHRLSAHWAKRWKRAEKVIIYTLITKPSKSCLLFVQEVEYLVNNIIYYMYYVKNNDLLHHLDLWVPYLTNIVIDSKREAVQQ